MMSKGGQRSSIVLVRGRAWSSCLRFCMAICKDNRLCIIADGKRSRREKGGERESLVSVLSTHISKRNTAALLLETASPSVSSRGREVEGDTKVLLR